MADAFACLYFRCWLFEQVNAIVPPNNNMGHLGVVAIGRLFVAEQANQFSIFSSS
ncbi:hypothetical protein [Pelobacter seleniigenes]|uniref:hypothetical protein n=1 Tax=Pelobacter seleniigenes TaxID=407188 RepID=UPI0012B9852C|nr:hypothetical protein [Pelobacter seleniigenes]